MNRIARLCLIAMASLIVTLGPNLWLVRGLPIGVSFDGVLPNAMEPMWTQPAQAQEGDSETANEAKPDSGDLKPFDEAVENLEVTSGLFKLYRNPEQQTTLLGIMPRQLNQNFLLVATLESGIGELGLFRGWPINDLVIQFREVPGHKLQVVVPNFALINPGQPLDRRQFLQQSFSDSVLFALPVISQHPDTQELLVDLGDLLLNRDPANFRQFLSSVLGNYIQNTETSYLGDAKLFPANLEVDTVLGFSGGGGDIAQQNLFSLPDRRGFNLQVHYSLALLTENPAFQPRPADERVGYFITAFRTPAQSASSDPFTRYIYRWHLEKDDPAAPLSPPKDPIVFWLENAIPQDYRQAIWEGVELWNQAFEQAGFQGAIEVRQMPDNADWDPADVRYNVIRWSDSFVPWALGLGPARVNPLTGEILDADIVLDASVTRYLNQQYETFITPTGGAEAATTFLQLCGHPLESSYFQWMTSNDSWPQSLDRLPQSQSAQSDQADSCAGMQAAQQTAFGALALGTLGDPFATRETQADYVNQYLRALTAHEIGHVLGLRHNFLGSTMLSPAELNNPDITETQGMLSSVMDYFPPNLAAPGQPQGSYFPTRLGPYDTWAIEYGYKPTSSPLVAHRELQAIAERSGDPRLAYAADEDIVDFLDPKANAWDLSSDPLQYAQWQIANAKAIWDKLDWYSVNPGEGYGSLRQRVDLVFNYYLRQALTLSNYIGGQRFNRVDPWSTRGQPPFETISAEDQHQALMILSQDVFSADALQIPAELVRLLAPDRWRHWGQSLTLFPLDYPIYNRILFIQAITLSDVMYSARLSRLRDGELQAEEGRAFTLGELFDILTQTIWSEIWDEESLGQDIDSVRRGLQRHYINILSNLVLRNASRASAATSFLDFIAMDITWNAPEDARVLARYHLNRIQDTLTRTINRHGDQMSLTSLAHLEDVRDRISKVLEARLEAL